MSGKTFFNSRKILTGLLVGLLGATGGVAATSYNIGVETTKVTQKLEDHTTKFIEIAQLIKENSTLTKEAIEKITEAIQKIQISIAVLESSSSHKSK